MDKIIEIILHSDNALMNLVSYNVSEAYLFLFLLVLLETGIILFPFLPGDGLLFSAGVLAASTDLDIFMLIILLIIAAISGNYINYYIGKILGKEIKKSNNYFIKRFITKYLPKTEMFYKKYGGKAVILGRFFPVIRTYIPFLAGVVSMDFGKFMQRTVIGAIAWVLFFSLTGFFTGNIKWVKNNYGLIYLSLIIITLLPFVFSILRNWYVKRGTKPELF